MVSIIIQTSLPARGVGEVRALLSPRSLPVGVKGHVEESIDTGLCAGPARGGKGAWVPCWISLQCGDRRDPEFPTLLDDLRRALVHAARQGGAELRAIPAAVQVGDHLSRVRDLGEVRLLLARDT